MKTHQAVLLLSLNMLLASETKSEVFTAQVHMEELLHTEGAIVKALEAYVEMEEQRLQKVKQLHKEYLKLQKLARRDPGSFLSNPVNSFLLVKRLTSDWDSAKSLFTSNTSQSLIENVIRERRFPDQEDLSGAATALMRLQDTYLLRASALAEGRIQGARSSIKLTAGDCHELGLQAFFSAEYNHTFHWMEEAFRRSEAEAEARKTADKADILEYLAYSSYMLGDFGRALEFTKDVLAINSSHARALENQKIYDERMRDQRGDAQNEAMNEEDNSTEPDTYYNYFNYEKLCREEKNKVYWRREKTALPVFR